MKRTDFVDWLKEHGACDPAIKWIDNLPDASPHKLWAKCPRGDWMAWLLAESGVPLDQWVPAMYAAAERAVSQYAADAMRAAGLAAQAELLAAVRITDRATGSAAWSAWSARSAAGSAAWSAWSAAVVFHHLTSPFFDPLVP